MCNCFTLRGNRPEYGIRLSPGIEYPEPIVLLGRGHQSCIVRMVPNNKPRHEGMTLWEASVMTTKRGKLRLTARGDWPGTIVRIIARNLNFGYLPLGKDLRLWPGGEADALFQAGRQHEAEVREQLFKLEEGEAILVVDTKACVARLGFEAGGLTMRPAFREEAAACLVSRALRIDTVQAIDWAHAMLRAIGMEHCFAAMHKRRQALQKIRHAAASSGR